MCTVQGVEPDPSGNAVIKEIVVKYGDGSFTLRDVQVFGRGVPKFKAVALNQLSYGCENPKFRVTLEGHDRQQSKVQHSFIATIETFCTWQPGHECPVVRELDFGSFAVDKYEIELEGCPTFRKLTQAEEDTVAERRRLAAAQEAKETEEGKGLRPRRLFPRRRS